VELGEEISAGKSVVFVVDKAIPATTPENGGNDTPCEVCGEEKCECDDPANKCEICGEEKCECDDPDAVQLLETIIHDEWHNRKFEYDGQNRLSKIFYTRWVLNGTDEGWETTTTTLNYNSAGDLISVIDNYNGSDETDTYVKTGNKIVINGNENSYYEVDAQGYLIKYVYKETYEDTEDKINFFEVTRLYTETYEYHNGNLIKVTLEDKLSGGKTETFVRTVTYTYDDKKSPLYNCKTPKWYLLAYRFGHIDGFDIQNNRLTISASDGKDVPTFTYTYDDAGYALTRTSNENGTELYTYIKK
jgi:hypothetical protein